MSKCSNPAIGKMIALYEFNQLSGEDKKRFEEHLLECDVCFQEIYEFSPVVKTIRKNIKKFQNASKRSMLQNLRERILLVTKDIKQFFQELLALFPKSLRPAIPAIALAVLVIAMLFIRQFQFKTTEKSDLTAINKNTSKRDSSQITLHEPKHMESRGSQDIKSTKDSAAALNDVSRDELFNSMAIILRNDTHHLLFTWRNIDHILYYQITLIAGDDRTLITPPQGINTNFYEYSVENLNSVAADKWELSGVLKTGDKFRVQKQFTQIFNR
jgi:hypothetical protein